MAAQATPPGLTVICGDDDYLVDRAGKEAFQRLTVGIDPEFGIEVIDGAALKVEAVREAVSSFIGAVRTLSLFGDRKVVWLRNVNFLGETTVGKTDGAKEQVEKLLAELAAFDRGSVAVLLTAQPVDRRRKEFKVLQKLGEVSDLKGAGDPEALAALVEKEATQLGAAFAGQAAAVLVSLTGGQTRLALEEVRKLATYAGAGCDGVDGRPRKPEAITEEMVVALVPPVGESDFFEPVEAFFSGKLDWTLASLERYFFTNKESRPVLASLSNRGRLAVQLRGLADAGLLKLSARGFPKGALAGALAQLGEIYPTDGEKSAFNLASQNEWFLGNKVAPSAMQFTLRDLMRFQGAFVEAFEGIIARPNHQHEVLRGMALQCLG